MKYRLISVVLILIFLSGMFSFSYADEIKGEFYSDMISSLGIMENSDSEFVSREEAIEALLYLSGINGYHTDYNVLFSDISHDDVRFPLVSTAVKHGIVIGGADNKVRLSDNTTYDEAVIMILRLMGYEIMVKARGGSYSDYLYIAKQYDFLDGVTISKAAVTREDFARLLYNTFSVGIVESESFSNDGKTNYIINNEKTSLSFLKMKIEKGIVTANSVSSVYYSSSPSAENTVAINNKIYTNGDTDAFNYLGHKVEYIYSTAPENENELIYIASCNKKTETYLLYPNFFKRENGGLVYEETDGTTQKIPVSVKSIMIKNGIAVPFDYSLITDSVLNGIVTFIDNGDTTIPTEYKIINIEEYTTDIVSGIDSVNKRIYLTNTKVNNKSYIEIKENYNISAERNNSKINYIEDIKTGDVISYYCSGECIVIKTLDKKVSGIPYEIFTETVKKVTINDNTYNVLGNAENASILSVNSEFDLFLDFMGNVAKVTIKTGKNYGYIISAGKNQEFEGSGILKLFTLDGKINIFELNDTVTFNLESRSDDFVINALQNDNENVKKGLIVYELDKKGKIRMIQTAFAPTGTDDEEKSKLILSRAPVGTGIKGYKVIDGVGVTGTVMFHIYLSAETGKPVEELCKVGGFNTAISYSTGLKFYDVDESGAAKAAIFISTISTEAGADREVTIDEAFSSFPRDICIYVKSTSVLNDEGMSVKKIYFYSKGELKSAILSSSLVYAKPEVAYNQSATDIFIDTTKKIKDLQPGDIFIYDTDANGELSGYMIYYDSVKYKNYDKGMIYLGGGGLHPMAREVQILKGSLVYKDSSIFNISTRGISEKSPKQEDDFDIRNYPFAITDAIVTIVNPERGVVRKGTLGEISVGSTVIVIANRDTVSEVIMYE